MENRPNIIFILTDDLENDPDERDNLAGQPQFQKKLFDLRMKTDRMALNFQRRKLTE